MPLLIFFIFSLNSFFACTNNKETIENHYNGEDFKIYLNKLEELNKKKEKKLEHLSNQTKNYKNCKDKETERNTALDNLLKYYEEFIELQKKIDELNTSNCKIGKDIENFKKYSKIIYDNHRLIIIKYAHIAHFFKKAIKKDTFFADKLYNFTKNKKLFYSNFWDCKLIEQ